MKYLQFNKITEKLVKIWNISKNIEIGRFEKMRVGQWETWCLFLNPDCYLTASCQDEVREKTKELNGERK
jgi:hypothetical protein